ncbi:MAG: hypothetical protein J6Y33_00470 [Prevotella sp.]|nr:hypothetical protein [Prevotella sp.]
MKIRTLFLTGLASLFAQQALAQTPKVVTDTRFARGATMAFGRIKSSGTNGGSAIQKRGFCLSETPEPTVDDIVSTKQLSNNGIIYYFDGLKPATKYYMRAYATNKDGVTGYGDAIKFYTLPMGTIKLSMRDGGDQTTYNRIKTAAETAVNWWNNLTEMKGFNPSVGYASGTATADCSYGGWIRVGPNTSYQRCGTIMHEMLHGIGVIPWADTEWSRHNLRSSVNGDGYGTGYWLGDRVTEVLTFWDNKTQQLNGDYQHMWPYGINGANEDNGTDLLYIGNSLVCQALGEDGLQHTSSLFAEPYYALNQEDTIKYYIKNEAQDRGLYTSFLKPNASGQLKWVEMTSTEAAANDSAAWYITFTPQNQYYQLRNAATGQYMTYSGGIKTAAKTALTANENWHLMRGRVDVDGQRGYWIIHPESNWTPKCLQANANGNTAQATFNIANTAEAQRWLIMTIEQTKAAEEKAVELMRGQVAEALQQVKLLAEVPHVCTDAATDGLLQTALVSLEQRMAEAVSTTELQQIKDEVRQAGVDFLAAGVSPTDLSKPFDLTYLLVNPTIDENTDGWTGAAVINYGCGEFYEKAFDFNQTVKDLPAGTYAFCVQGFQRPGSTSASYQDYKAGTNKVNATVYAGGSSAKLAHICDTILSRKIGKGNESAVASGKYVPNDMQAASAYFGKGFYENQVLTSVTADGGSLKVGVKSTNMSSAYWVIFDNFRLYYYGSVSADEVTGVEGAAMESRQTRKGTVYDLLGRRVANPVKGLYIVNGKKIVIK